MSDTGVSQTKPYPEDQEFRVLSLILRVFRRLSGPGKRWLVARLNAELRGRAE